MGGYGSTRWGWEHTRQDTDPLLKLDIRTVRNMGALQPGAYATHSWKCRGEPSGTITTIMQRDRPCLRLDYSTRGHNETEWTPVREDVWIDETACNYGGTRPWFVCSGCNQRRGVLFSVNGRFRCRQCHRLAYSSTREAPHERSIRRCQELQRKLGGGGYGHAIWEIPRKSDHMSWRKYHRISMQLMDELRRQDDLFEAHFFRKFAYLLDDE